MDNTIKRSALYSDLEELRQRLVLFKGMLKEDYSEDERIIQQIEEDLSKLDPNFAMCNVEHSLMPMTVLDILSKPGVCGDFSAADLFSDVTELKQLREYARQGTPQLREVLEKIGSQLNTIDRTLNDAREVVKSGLLKKHDLSLDSYLVATLCMPEREPSAYRMIIADQKEQALDICSGYAVSHAKGELRSLCESQEQCNSLLGELSAMAKPKQNKSDKQRLHP